MLSPDYAKFTLENGVLMPGERMAQKIQAIPFPFFNGKTVLDVGCDYGQFSFYAASRGAKVTGLDRNRDVKGVGFTDLVTLNNANAKENNLDAVFYHTNLGKQWHEFGTFDHILVMSVYHHIFENCGDHKPIWFWLWRHCKESVIWEGPLDSSDKVVQMNVSRPYSKDEILEAAHIYFTSEYIGPALHEPNRHVYIFTPKKSLRNEYCIALQDGAGGATGAFNFQDQRRVKEIENILGYAPFPGSLNCLTNKEFNWGFHYLTGEILDVKDRSAGLNSEWILRETRFYPVKICGKENYESFAHILRMKGESYATNFIEIIAPVQLRPLCPTEIEICA